MQIDTIRLKNELKKNGLSGKKLSEMLGVAEMTISNITQGKTFPKPETLTKIAEILDVDVRALILPTKTQKHTEIFKKINDEYISIGFLIE